MSQRLDFPPRRPLPSAAAIGVALLVVWAPLPFGSVVPWAVTVLRSVTLVLAVAAIIAERGANFRHALTPAAGLLAVAALGWAQSVALPAAVGRVLAPEAAQLRAASAPLTGAGGGWQPLSLAPEMSRAAALSWATFALLLLAAAAAGRRRRNRRVILAAVVAAAVFQVVFGARHVGSAAIWDRVVAGDSGRLRGTFVNPDHAALFLGISLAAAFAWGWAAVRRARHEVEAERRLLLVAPPAAVWLTIFLGLAFTGSRAGLVAAVVGTSAQGLLAARAVRRWRLSPAGIVAAAVGVGVVGVVGLQQGLGRWLATSAHELAWNERLAVDAGAVETWLRSPWLGTGLGTFRESSPLVLSGVGNWYWHAHNDPLELLATVGLVGFAIVAAAAVLTAGALLRRQRRGRRSEDRAAALAALGALVTLAVHSCFDFGLSIPANAALAAVVIGAALWPSAPPAEPESAPAAPAP